MAFIDQDLVMVDDAVVTSTADVIDLDASGLNNGIGNSPADYVNVEANSALTGTLVVTVRDSADNSTFANTDVSYTFDAAAVIGTGVSLLLPKELRRYATISMSGATAGNVSAWIGQRKF